MSPSCLSLFCYSSSFIHHSTILCLDWQEKLDTFSLIIFQVLKSQFSVVAFLSQIHNIKPHGYFSMSKPPVVAQEVHPCPECGCLISSVWVVIAVITSQAIIDFWLTSEIWREVCEISASLIRKRGWASQHISNSFIRTPGFSKYSKIWFCLKKTQKNTLWVVPLKILRISRGPCCKWNQLAKTYLLL